MNFFKKAKSVSLLRKKKPVTLLNVGLEHSGKSTIVNFMKPEVEKTDVTPTVGFIVEKFSYSGVRYNIFDMSGQGRYRGMWEYFLQGVDGIIFTVDCTDRDRLSTCRDELQLILRDKRLRNIPLLVFANKQDGDEDETVNPGELSQILELETVEDRNWDIKGSVGITGRGIPEGMGWIAQNARKRK